MLTREKIRKTDVNKLITNKRTEDTDFKKSENRTFREAEDCIIRMIKKTEEQNADESVKNKFFIKKTETTDKKKLIIFLENINSLFIFFFSESRDSEKVKKITII